MNTIRKFLMTAVFSLLMVSTAAFAYKNAAGEKCQPVNAIWYGTDYLEGPENCDEFLYCIPGILKGSLNGELTYFGTADEIMNYWGVDGELGGINFARAEQRISTQHGDIITESLTLYDSNTGVYTELLVVTEGTGKYENASGRMVNGTSLPPSPGKPVVFNGRGELTGYICTP